MALIPVHMRVGRPVTAVVTMVTTTTTAVGEPSQTETVTLRTLKGCRLGIGRYPYFAYDAQGGVGVGVASASASAKGARLEFDASRLRIPALTWRTARVAGLPVPPGLRVGIEAQALHGWVDRETGQVELQLQADFVLEVGVRRQRQGGEGRGLLLYRAPPLRVETVLTTEAAEGWTGLRGCVGRRMDEEGCCRLVAVALVQPVHDRLLNAFLGLPTECLAELSCKITFSSSSSSSSSGTGLLQSVAADEESIG